jgi:hypothetical protein
LVDLLSRVVSGCDLAPTGIAAGSVLWPIAPSP